MLVGLHEWPLIAYTTLTQTAIGGFFCVALALFSNTLNNQQTRIVRRNQIVIWLLMGVAVLLSVFHLGSPMRAFNALLMVGSSSLSNEIFATALFLGCGSFYWLVAISNKISKTVEKLFLIVTILAAIYLAYAMCQVYQITTVPTWNNPFTAINFMVTLFLAGSVLGCLLLSSAINESPFTHSVLPFLAITALIISVVSQFIQMDDLAVLRSSVISATELVPHYGTLMAYRVILIVVGLLFWFVPQAKGKPTTWGLVIASLLIILAEMLGRSLFYGLHMTVGVI